MSLAWPRNGTGGTREGMACQRVHEGVLKVRIELFIIFEPGTPELKFQCSTGRANRWGQKDPEGTGIWRSKEKVT